MVASPRRSCRTCLNTDGVDIPAAHLEDDPRQRTSGRARGWHTGPKIKTSFMTRTVKAAFSGARNHGAREMGAFLVERDELARGQTDQQAAFVFVRICESHHSTN